MDYNIECSMYDLFDVAHLVILVDVIYGFLEFYN